MRDFKDEIDPELLAILQQKDTPLDGDDFTRGLMQRIEAEESLLATQEKWSWFRPATLGAGAVAAVAIGAPGLVDVGTALLHNTQGSYLEMGQMLGVAAVAAMALLVGLTPVANSLGEALAGFARPASPE